MKVTAWGEWISRSRLGVIVCYPSQTEERQGTALLQQTVEWIRQHLHFTVTIGVGQAVDGHRGLSDSYERALEALSYKSVLGGDRVIERPGGNKHQNNAIFDHMQHIRGMVENMTESDDRWQDSYRKLVSVLQDSLYSKEEIVHLFNYFLYTLSKRMPRLPDPIRELWVNETREALQSVLSQMETVGEMTSEWEQIISEFYNERKAYRNPEPSSPLIKEVISYLHRHYAREDISLQQLSDVFGISAKYLSHLFKEELRENFIDYLTKIRMEHAKRLLLDTSDTVQEIARQVGYIHSFTFVRAFKRVTGQTPGDFRRDTGS